MGSDTMIVTKVGDVLMLMFGLEANPAPGPKPAPAPSPFMWGEGYPQPGPVLPPYQPGGPTFFQPWVWPDYWRRKPKPPRPRHPKSSMGCFGMETLVTTCSGEQKLMRDLRIGDEVLSDGTGSLTKFIGWIDRGSNKETDMIEIQTEDGEQLTLTGSHIIFYYENGEQASTYAKNLNPGNVIVGGSGEEKIIMNVNHVWKIGYLDPLTESGTIVTNNITTSCYASFPHHLSDLASLPAKMFPELLLDNHESQYKEGCRTYYRIIKWIGRSFGGGFEKITKEYKVIGVFGFTTFMYLAMLSK